MVRTLAKRDLRDLAWCALVSRVPHLQWIEGLALCVVVDRPAVAHLIHKGEAVISELCWSPMPEYKPWIETYEGQRIPVVRMDGVPLFRYIAEFVRRYTTTSPREAPR